MPIEIVCPGCKKRFGVSERFAGKTGPCPQCKTPIKIPEQASDEVTVHAPTDFEAGGRGTTGKLLIKPITHAETRLSPVQISMIVGSAMAVVIVAWLIGRTGSLGEGLLGRCIGLLVVSPALVAAGYTFLRDSEELEPFRSTELLLRAVICSIPYIAFWWGFAYVAGMFATGELWVWIIILPPFFLLGAMTALVSLDFDFGSAFLHYVFYVLVTSVLGRLAGTCWPWEIVASS